MGEVYRGRDTRLGRDVAIKALPDLFANDPERSGRLLREAQILASLNHSNIAGIYGLEDDGRSKFLVLEFIDGGSLADRLTAGPIPVDEAVVIARQIAEALEAAHEKRIVHRDLKPGNVMLTSGGQAKVLDFGLARATGGSSSSDVMNPPTLTFAATQAGVILGTAAYMAPEQAKGRAVDKRSDIWAFGVLLFEMLAGSHPFRGETISEMIAAIIKDSPAWAVLPKDLPPALHALLHRMLEKDPRRRLRDIGDARLVLEDVAAGTEADPVASAPVSRGPRWRAAAPAMFAIRTGARPDADLPALKYTLPITGESLPICSRWRFAASYGNRIVRTSTHAPI
jgi:eukaryotic-like serine/threonine-protein kinase